MHRFSRRMNGQFSVSVEVLMAVSVGWAAMRMALVALFPSHLAQFASDEMTFASLAHWVAVGANPAMWSDGWGASLFPETRTLMVPSSWLVLIGLNPLLAVRWVSILYSCGAQLALIATYSVVRRDRSGRPAKLELMSLPFLGFAVFLALPSHVLWGTLALRDSASEFWAVTAVLLATIATMGHSDSSRQRARWAAAVGLAAVISLAFQSRAGMGIALCISLVLAVPSRSGGRITLSYLLLAAISLGAVAGLISSAPLAPVARHPEGTKPTIASSPMNGFVAVLGSNSDAGQLLERRSAAPKDASTAFDTFACQGAEPRPICELRRLPAAIPSVLLRPIWPFDQISGQSLTSQYAQVENALWAALFAGALFVGRRREVANSRVLRVAFTQATLVILFMSVGEGNLGTAFRHKSQLLWVICLVFLLSVPRAENPQVPRLRLRKSSSP